MNLNELFRLTHRHSAKELQNAHPLKDVRILEVKHEDDVNDEASVPFDIVLTDDEIKAAEDTRRSDDYDSANHHQQ